MSNLSPFDVWMLASAAVVFAVAVVVFTILAVRESERSR